MTLDPVLFGVLLLLTGLVFCLLVWGLPRIARKGNPKSLRSSTQRTKSVDSHGHAVLVVHPGGRVNYVNEAAREWFDLREGEQPDLELLARRIRPGEEFLKICAAEGQARFSVNGRPAECVSYQMPDINQSILITMHRPGIGSSRSAGSKEESESAVKILSDFSQSMTADLDLEETIRVILENIERLVPADILVLKLWDEANDTLIPFRAKGELEQEKGLEKGTPISPALGWSAGLMENRQILSIPDLQKSDILPDLTNLELERIHSYIGLPLISGDNVVGTIEVGLSSMDAFADEDLHILQLVCGQAATAIRNATLLGTGERRSVELISLEKLTSSLVTCRDSQELYAKLVQGISPLFDVEVLGFLILNETRHTLEAKMPFTGMPAQIVDLYQLSLAPGSQAEKTFNDQKVLFTQNAMEDITWAEIGFQDYARAASWRDTALIPLVSNRKMLGYLQVSNHRKPETAFSPDEMRLLSILANQTAPIIENVSLLQQVQQRERNLEVVQRITAAISSSSKCDEAARSSIHELAQALKADFASLHLLDIISNELRLHTPSQFGLTPEAQKIISDLFTDDSKIHSSVTISNKPLLCGYLAGEQSLDTIYGPIFEALGIQSALIVPLQKREHAIGELMLLSRIKECFNDPDVQLVSTVADQLAAVFEAPAYLTQTDESLQRQLDQLSFLSQINRELNANLDWDQLLRVIYDYSLQMSKAECGCILILDPKITSGEEPRVIQLFGDEHGKELLKIETAVLKNGKAILVDNQEGSSYPASHPKVQSVLVVPIVIEGKIGGLIHLHSSSPNFFNEDTLEKIQTLAIQAANAMGNTQQVQEQVYQNALLVQRNQTLTRLFNVTSTVTAEQPLEQSLNKVCEVIQETTPFQMVLMSIVDPENLTQQRITGVGMPVETLNMLKGHQQPWEALTPLLRDEFRMGSGYFIPHEKRPAVSNEVDLVTLLEDQQQTGEDAWHPEDAYFFPLFDEDQNPIGLISLDAPSNGLRPDAATHETLETVAQQTTRIIQSTRRLTTYQARAETLSTSLDRQQQLLTISQSHLPMLMHKDLEQMISIRNLDRRARRIRAGLEITETINNQLDGPSMLQALGREILTRLDMSVSLVAENTDEGARLLHVLGNVPRGLSPEALFGQRNPLRTSLQSGEAILVMDLEQEETWRDAPLLINLHAKSFVCLPILIGEKPVAGILAISREPMPAMTEEDRQTYFQIARQSSIILQNISLLTETRRRLREVNLLLDFSRHLSGLDLEGIVKALVESALRVVASAHAGVVLLYDSIEGLLVPKAAEGYADVDSLMKITHRAGESLPGRTFVEGKIRRVDEVIFSRDYSLSTEALMHYREATGGRMPVSSLVVPIQMGEQALGVLVLDNFNTPAVFTNDDEVLLQSLAQQVALSLENIRLVQNSQERASQLQALTEVSAKMTSSLESSDLVSGLLDRLMQLVVYDTAILWLKDEKRMTVTEARGFPDNEERAGQAVEIEESLLLAEINRSMQSIVVGDVGEDPRFTSRVRPERLSWMGIPLISKGEVSGVIVLEKTEPNFYTLEMAQIANTFTNQAAIAIQNARLYAETRRLADELEQRVVERTAELSREQRNTETLLRILTEASATLDLERALSRTLELLNDAIGAEQGSILMVNLDTRKLEYRAGYGEETEGSLQGSQTTTLQAGEVLAGWVIEHGEAVRIDDVSKDKRWKKGKGSDARHHSVIATPLLVSEEAIGAIMVFHHQEGYFTPEHSNLVQAIGNQVAVAINNAQLYKLIRDQAENMGSMLRSQQVDASRQQAILEAVADGVLVTDPTNIITFLNSSSENILGLDSTQILGQPLDSFAGLFGKAAQTWMQTIRGWSEDPGSHQPGDTYAEQLTLETGRVILVHLAPVIWHDDFLGTVSIFRDITHEVEVDRLKSEFVATVSHELRTPMTSIKGYVDILLMGAAGALNENQSNFLKIVQSNTERLSILVNDLLDISRIEAGRVALSFQAIDLREVAENVVSDVQKQSKEENKPMELRVEASPDLPRISGDLERVRQIMTNIVENAYHYTPENGKIVIQLGMGDDSMVQVDVTDNGIGIDSIEAERIFERFYRGEHPMVLATPGTGLGLAIVRQLVTMHKGKIWMKSKGLPGEGSTFSLTLPVYKAEE